MIKYAIFIFFILVVFSSAHAQQNFNNLNVKNLTSNKIDVTSTTQSSKPCPAMSLAQRDAISSPSTGSCVYNTTDLQLNVYDGSAWQAAGGGGIDNWETGKAYDVDAVVIESNKIYQANTAHTSGTFATDIANWTQLSNNVADVTGVLPMANGGTDKALTPELGGIVYTDAGSMEVLAPGTAGQILQTNGAAAPTYVNKSISGKAENQSSVTVEEIQAPNNLLTQTATNKYLNETGNNNILINPSFENMSDGTGWSFTGTGSAAINANSVIHGKKSAEISTTAQTIDIVQSSSLYASSFADGVQGLASIRVKTTHTGTCSVCSVQAGTVSTTNCVTVQANNKWGLYKVPMILGATSNGISLACTSGTGLTYVDDAFVGAVDLKADVDQSRIAGESYFAGTTSCTWSRTSTTVGAFTATSACPGPTIVTSTMGQWLTTDSDLPRQTINNLPAGTYKAKFYLNMSTSGGNVAAISINDGTTTCEAVQSNNSSTTDVGQVVECTFTYTSSGNRTFEVYGASSAGSLGITNNRNASPRISTKFILEYFGSGSVYTSTCGANCVDTFSALVSSTGVVSDDELDWINGNCTNGSAGQYSCTITSGIFTVAPRCWIENSLQGGSYGAGSTSTSVTATLRNTGGSLANGAFTLFCKKTGADFNATRNIIGQFNEVMVTPNVTKPKTCYYAFGGASATLASPTVCAASPCIELYDSCGAISAPTRGGTGDYTINIANGTFANSSFVKCDFQCGASGGYRNCNNRTAASFMIADTSGGLVINLSPTNQTGTASDSYATFECIGSAP